MTPSAERTTYCLPCDRVIVWREWRTLDRHNKSSEHRECVIAPRPLPPDRLRSADLDDPLFGLAEGESAVFHRPDGRWIGLAALGGGATVRVEGIQRGLVIDRLRQQLGPEAKMPKQICLRCRLILDPVILGYHTTSREHRANPDPWVGEPVAMPLTPAPRPEPAVPEPRFDVSMEPLLISTGDASRILGISSSKVGELARGGGIPSVRIGSRVLIPVEALRDWVAARAAEDAERFAAPWARLSRRTTSTTLRPERRVRRVPK